MEVIQTFPNGTTIEAGTDSRGIHIHRVCNSSRSLCRYVESHHIAVAYAQQYEDCYQIKPEVKV
jgi:hypothetical protein